MVDPADPDPFLVQGLIAEIDERLHIHNDLVQLLEGAPEMLREVPETDARSWQILKTQASQQRLMLARQLLGAELERQGLPLY
jgi:hypothetical protein